MILKKWNLFEILWLLSFSTMAVVLSIIWDSSIFGLTVFVSGVICVVLAAKGNIWTYVFGAYNSLAYGYLSFLNGLYGETMLNIIYYFPMQIIGWFFWRNRMQGSTVIMRKMTKRGILIVSGVSSIGIITYGYWLSTLAGQNTPYIDAFTTVFSIIAMVLMALRYREQWVLFILINIVSIIMWSYRFINGSQDASTMVIMWSAYLVNSIYGFITWYKGSSKLNDKSISSVNRGVING